MSLKYFLAITFGLFLGILFAYKLNFSSSIFLVSLVITLINFLIYKFLKPKNYRLKNETTIFIFFLFLFLSLGILLGQYNLSKNISQKNNFQTFVSGKNNFTGEIIKIENTENSKQLIVKLESQENYKVKLITSKIETYKIGTQISFLGKLETDSVLLPNLKDNINTTFDMGLQNSLDKIYGQIIFPKIEILGNQNNFISNLRNLKNNFVENLDIVAPRIVSAISAGTTLGDKSLLSKNEINNFRQAGLSHVLVLSGFNISILIVFFGIIFLALNLKLYLRIGLSILVVIFFIFFVGAEASIIRAGIMGSMLLVSQLFGKQYVAKQGLFLSAFLMMLIDPKIAPYDVSFHLSFLATFAILYIYPILEDYPFLNFSKTKNKILKNFSEIFKITLAVQVMVLPYLMFVFHKISLLGILANVLVVPIIPIIMLLTILIILTCYLYTPLAIFLGYVNFIFCKYISLIAEWIANMSLSKISTNLSVVSLIIMYLLIIFLIYFEDKRLRLQKYLNKN